MSSATRSTLMIARQHFPKLGLEFPAELTAELDEIDHVFANQSIITFSRRALAEAVADALAGGKDPATDKTVAPHLARAQMQGMNLDGELAQVGEDRRAAALRRHADSIIDSLAGVVDRADETLEHAREQIPGLDLTNDERVRSMSPEQMATWGRAREALAHVGHAAQLWTMLVSACDLLTVQPHRRPLVIAELSLPELDALGHQPHATAAVHAGHRLSLATPSTFAERLARLEDDRSYQATQGERDFAEKVRTTYGAGKSLLQDASS
jgi:hypothetical protein